MSKIYFIHYTCVLTVVLKRGKANYERGLLNFYPRNFVCMQLYIKNMVCNRCILVIEQELEKAGLQASQVKLGKVTLTNQPTKKQLEDFKEQISSIGFELLDSQKQQLIEQIKTLIIEKIQKEVEEH